MDFRPRFRLRGFFLTEFQEIAPDDRKENRMKKTIPTLFIAILLASPAFSDKAILKTRVPDEDVLGIALVNGRPFFSYQEGGKFYASDGKRKSKAFDYISHIDVSKNGRAQAYWTVEGGEAFIHHGEKKYGPYEAPKDEYDSFVLFLSSDGKKLFYEAKDKGGIKHLFENGRKIGRIHSEYPGSEIYTPNFELLGYIDCEGAEEQYLYLDGKKFGPYKDLRTYAMLGEGKNVVSHFGRTEEGWFLFHEGRKAGPYKDVSSAAIYEAKNGRNDECRISYGAETEGGWNLFHEGKKIAVPEPIEDLRIFTDGSGMKIAYSTRGDDEIRIHNGEATYAHECGEYDNLRTMFFMPKTGKLLYTIGDEYGAAALYVDGEQKGESGFIDMRFFDGNKFLYQIGNKIYDEEKLLLETDGTAFIQFYDGTRLAYMLTTDDGGQFLCTTTGIKIGIEEEGGETGSIYAIKKDGSAVGYTISAPHANGCHITRDRLQINHHPTPGRITDAGIIIYMKNGVMYKKDR